MKVIDADKFLTYLIFSKHIDELTCGEVKEAIEMCKVDVLDKIRSEIIQMPTISLNANDIYKADVLQIINKYME